ncbi:hypothetical protein FOE78_15145 [Microlunatus elymi]|uniref:Sialidase domain-containing protein n=1 Tax=Microlunatus elymi TaxID=2596828 RepID=A0A516Q0W7_9ACTN|nr:sialidase family protein [Microlunatus elymi]QDP97083.1 hypothetical protein FOE78_15145 [Microlunatus elymi]
MKRATSERPRLLSKVRLTVAAAAAGTLTLLAVGSAALPGTAASADGRPGVAQGPAGGYACRQYLPLPDNSYLPPDITKWRVHAGTLAQAPNGDLLYAFYGGKSEGSADQNLYLSRLPKGESTWQKPQLLFDEPGKADGNPILWTDGKVVHAFFVTIFGHGWEQSSIRQISSVDNGRSWSAPTYIHQDWGLMTGTRPFRMSNGEVLLPVYDEAASTSGFMIAGPDLKTWTAYPSNHEDWLHSPNGSIQPTVVELEPGHLLAYLRTGDGSVYRTQSTDYGRTWSTPERSELGNPNSRVALLKLDNGDLVVGYNPWVEHHSPLRISLSTDKTKTWTPPWSYTVDVENAMGPQYTYPYLIQSDDGMIHMAYSANRDRMAEITFNEQYLESGVSLLSKDGWGATEFRNGRVSSVDRCKFRMGQG